MKINLEIVERPWVSGFTMFAKPNLSLLQKTKTIRVLTQMVTKTRVATAYQIGECRRAISLPIEGFKTFEKTEYCYYTSQESVSHYFVLSKKQNREVYIEYVKKVIEQFVKNYNLDLDEITIHLEEPKF